MGSSESKQAASRLQGASLSHIHSPTETLLLRYQKSLSLKLQLCDEDSHPLYLVTLPNGWSGDLVLYGGVSKDNDAPLAVVTGKNKHARGVHHTVKMAPLVPGGQIVEEELRLVGRGFLRVRVGYTFVLDGEGAAVRERFEWRGSRGEEVQSLGQRWHGWKLVRLRSEGTGRQPGGATERGVDGRIDAEEEEDDDEKGEVVAVWADVHLSKSVHDNAAMFKFIGSGASDGELGMAFRAMAVATFLRLWQLNSQSGAGAVDGASANAAAALVAAGV